MQIMLAKQGLNTTLLDNIYKMEGIPDDWDKYKKKAILLDNQWH